VAGRDAISWRECRDLLYGTLKCLELTLACTGVYNEGVSKKLVLWLVVGSVMGIMLIALIYGCFDIHDIKPFPSDPESSVVIASALLMLSFRVLLISILLLGGLVFLAAWFCPLSAANEHRSLGRSEPKPFISPPHIAISLRI
jgi:hypothetical protein